MEIKSKYGLVAILVNEDTGENISVILDTNDGVSKIHDAVEFHFALEEYQMDDSCFPESFTPPFEGLYFTLVDCSEESEKKHRLCLKWVQCF